MARPSRFRAGRLARLVRFNLTTGVLSIVSNVVLMGLFVGRWKIHHLVANLLAIAVTSIANFLVSEKLVFRPIASAAALPHETGFPLKTPLPR